MSIRKRNEYLDLPSDEEEEDGGYDSEDQGNSRIARGTKRRRISQAPDDSVSELQEDEEGGDDEGHGRVTSTNTGTSSKKSAPAATSGRFDFSDEDINDEQEDSDDLPNRLPKSNSKSKTSSQASAPTALSTLAARATSAHTKSLKTGVVYLSRIPPFLKPSALRSLLTPYAPHGLLRLFLTPEDPVSYRSRVKSGGNKKRTFTDGWVEFASKRDAKIAAETLNTQIIGGKKGGWYHDDVWNIKYLKGFKWRDLTEQINQENAERSARMRVEIARTTRENRAFVEGVERSRREEGIRETRRKRGDVEGEDDGRLVDDSAVVEKAKKRPQNFTFRQNEVKGSAARAKDQPEDVKRVLSKIF